MIVGGSRKVARVGGLKVLCVGGPGGRFVGGFRTHEERESALGYAVPLLP